MFVDGGNSKTYIVDISILYDFHSTPSTIVHWKITFRWFFSISAENPLSSPVSWLPSLVSCLPSPVFCLLSLVSCLFSFVSCLLSHVSHAESENDLADLTVLWRKFADLGNLAILTVLADLAEWNTKILNGHAIGLRP